MKHSIRVNNETLINQQVLKLQQLQVELSHSLTSLVEYVNMLDEMSSPTMAMRVDSLQNLLARLENFNDLDSGELTELMNLLVNNIEQVIEQDNVLGGR